MTEKTDKKEPMSLLQKMLEVTARVNNVPKRGRNDFHKYDYATEADILEAVRPLLIELGLVIIPTVCAQEVDGNLRRAGIEFAIADVDSGERIVTKFVGEGQDSGDKGFYKAYTGAQKYFFTKTFLIPTGDDPERDNGAAKAKPKQRSKPAAPPEEAKEPLSAEEAAAAFPGSEVAGTTDDNAGAEDAAAYDDEQRSKANARLFATLNDYAKAKGIGKQKADDRLHKVIKDRYGAFSVKTLSLEQIDEVVDSLREAINETAA